MSNDVKMEHVVLLHLVCPEKKVTYFVYWDVFKNMEYKVWEIESTELFVS